ncbi:hypothetical protein L596_001983 [Steinernema carpocapsae]|uniref:Uncharacterized protein n=1 Tax=Steinernema carpocapsae TaxID=34508 RepID=A0A4V6YSU4_STECR|nr:hypothetical protein L596_001983 [Steinernema carpocapsae]
MVLSLGQNHSPERSQQRRCKDQQCPRTIAVCLFENAFYDPETKCPRNLHVDSGWTVYENTQMPPIVTQNSIHGKRATKEL